MSLYGFKGQRLRKAKMKKLKIQIFYVLLIAIIILCTPSLILLNKDKDIIKQANADKTIIYSYKDLKNVLAEETIATEYSFSFGDDIIFDGNIPFQVQINNYNTSNKYELEVIIDGQNKGKQVLSNSSTDISLKVTDEGEKNIKLNLYKNNSIARDYYQTIYYIKPYEKQFLDELNNYGVQVHFRDQTMEPDYRTSINLISKLGVNYIRDDFLMSSIYKNSTYDFSKYDDWINLANENDLKILGLLGSILSQYGGSNKLIDNDIEITNFANFAYNVKKQYPFIEDFEILNEVNLKSSWKGAYVTKEQLNWYNKLMNRLAGLKLGNINLAGVATAITTTSTQTSYMDFYNWFFENNEEGKIKNIYGMSFHPYKSTADANNGGFMGANQIASGVISKHGGFTKTNISEYGYTMTGTDQAKQAESLVQETSILSTYNDVEIKSLYNFWSKGTNTSNSENNFGITTYYHKPKKAYYAMKNYYKNINGSEFVGTISLSNTAVLNVYDKDGKVKMIAWDTNNSAKLDCSGMTVSDIYGNEVEVSNNKITLSNSPVYLDNVSSSYFYKAISNTISKKINEFKQNYSSEIDKVSGLSNKLDDKKSFIQSIEKVDSLDENIAITQMQELYAIGDEIISAYNEGKLNISAIKCSSMLDALNNIGNYYEDLITVSSKTLKLNYSGTDDTVENEFIYELNSYNAINYFMGKLYTNESIYGAKMLNFAKKLYDESNYINSLTESNSIKTGLIVSKNLQSTLLMKWAKDFAKISSDEYGIKIDRIKYSTKEPTQGNVDVTISTNKEIYSVVGWKLSSDKKSITKTFTENKTESVTLKDKYGVTITLNVNVNNIDRDPPEATVQEFINSQYNKVTLLLSITDQSEIPSVVVNGKRTMPDSGKAVQVKTSTNQKYTFVITDKAGNKAETSYSVTSIDDTPPVIENIENNFVYKEAVTPQISDGVPEDINQNISGIRSVILKKDGKQIAYSIDNPIAQNGYYQITVKDLAGNGTTKFFQINGIKESADNNKTNNDNKTDEKQETEPVKNEVTNTTQEVVNEVTNKTIEKESEINDTANTVTNEITEKPSTTNNSVSIKIKKSSDSSSEKNEETEKPTKEIFEDKNMKIIKINVSSGEVAQADNDTQITDENGNKKQSTAILVTGDKVTKNEETYTIVVSGDINGTGSCETEDLTACRAYLLGLTELTEEQQIAADVNNDGQVDLKDLLKIRKNIYNK